ncbi:MAG: DNA mismatch repair protein MutS [Clostridia bacterium]|nr:DNA mismatch repair protein MutS [Clostridia bacterium]
MNQTYIENQTNQTKTSNQTHTSNQNNNSNLTTTSNQTYELTGFQYIREALAAYANSETAKERARLIEPMLRESELRKAQRDTTQAKRLLVEIGTPPVPRMTKLSELIDRAECGELLSVEEVESVGVFLVAVKRMKSYLEKGKEQQIGLAFYCENLEILEELRAEIESCIRDGEIDDRASALLYDTRRKIQLHREKINEKAEHLMKTNKEYLADNFVVRRNGRICIPVKKSCRGKIAGSVIDQSSTGATLFVEPTAIANLQEELELFLLEEENEERRILYQLLERISEHDQALRENIRVITELDFIFAKAKMSVEMNAVEPEINTEAMIKLKAARNPLLEQSQCVPLDFSIGGETRGVIITGPNTGGKTVAIKTVALMSMMACAGLHVPCVEAKLSMQSQVLCDIGDGQNIADNLSTFSAHITNVIQILKHVTRESLVIMDELGSGTDPAEGMGIAISILEELRKSNCLFLVTTHYPEVKEYAMRYLEIQNARMTFDRESLKPLYELEIGKAGDSCALYIAKRLGVPNSMLRTAAKEAYGSVSSKTEHELALHDGNEELKHESAPKLERIEKVKREAVHGEGFHRGDSVTVLPEGKIGIVAQPADHQGNVLVQVAKEKFMISHKRLKLKVAATQLYPEDYDFSIIFDTVEHRKARHQMGKKYQEGLEIAYDPDECI